MGRDKFTTGIFINEIISCSVMDNTIISQLGLVEAEKEHSIPFRNSFLSSALSPEDSDAILQ